MIVSKESGTESTYSALLGAAKNRQSTTRIISGRCLHEEFYLIVAMAFQAFRESKLHSSICRLSPPSSPSRSRSVSQNSTAHTVLSTSNSVNTTRLPPLFSKARKSESAGEPSGINGKASIGVLLKPTESADPAVSDLSANSDENGVENQTSATKAPTASMQLPLYSHTDYSPSPVVVYTRHEEEADELVQAMKGPLGFDLEWCVFFRKNMPARERRTALVQLCDQRMILLVQVSAMKKFPQKVKEVIESPNIVKMGANIRNDGQKLFRDYGITAANMVELGAFAHQADPEFSKVYKRSIVSLIKVVEMYTQKTLDKGEVRMSNWEGVPLTRNQITYAANDAHCALMVYNRLATLATENRRVLRPESYTSNLAMEYASQKAAVPRPASFDASSVVSTSANATKSPATTVSAISAQTATWTAALLHSWPSSSRPPPRQHLRAYNLWHYHKMPLDDIRAELRSKENPLAASTVISYVVLALQAHPSLPFSMERLKAFVQLEAGSWGRHKQWILSVDRGKR
ncbi:Werner syndrome ATP-dependent helicase [Grifola frondosa]|uniref:Werner syndrome ATP-dependent helicase n=1 Tax=Grifola frondosa TaxID=5627 RepID=A0A1C7LNK3_GRIFR|nr:Werner syndrome ATP-dependent helicase [Grifola frondosa]